ncbi:MAG: DUF86 domain-containing protein, partial [Candidatus Edwardsbacteria bacterium]|nr:DUF86 domain-containing protein [Candidatus Edwardsbacteria bacterium]
MSKRDSRLYVEDILECIVRVEEYTGGLTYQEFAGDAMRIDAVIRNFEVIGEAARQLPDDFKSRNQGVDWKALSDFRNVVIHQYFGVNIQ